MTAGAAVRGDVSLAYCIDGAASLEPVLFCHALGTTADLWGSQAASLASRTRVVRYDARGHGSSTVARGPTTLDDLGRDALAVIDAAGLDTTHVVGLSLGGLTAMWLGVHAPERVRSLVLANTAARIGTPSRWADRIACVGAEGMAGVADAAIARWFSEGFRRRQPAIERTFREMLLACRPEGYIACCEALAHANLGADVRRIRARTLVVAGSADTSTPVSDAVVLRDRIPGSTLVVLDAAHLSNVEQADAFTGHLEAFLLDRTAHAHG